MTNMTISGPSMLDITADVTEEHGGFYVDRGTLHKLTLAWQDTAQGGYIVLARDDLMLLAYVDGDTGKANAHAVEFESGLGWSIPEGGWYPLEWTIEQAGPELWHAEIADGDAHSCEFESPESIRDDLGSTFTVTAHRDEDGVITVDIDTESLDSSETHMQVRVNGAVLPGAQSHEMVPRGFIWVSPFPIR